MIIFTILESVEENKNPSKIWPEHQLPRVSKFFGNIHLTYSLYNLEDSIDTLELDFKKCNPRRYGQNQSILGLIIYIKYFTKRSQHLP